MPYEPLSFGLRNSTILRLKKITIWYNALKERMLNYTETIEDEEGFSGKLAREEVSIDVPLVVVTNNFIGSARIHYKRFKSDKKVDYVAHSSLSLKCIQYPTRFESGFVPEMVEVVMDREDAIKLRDFINECLPVMPSD